MLLAEPLLGGKGGDYTPDVSSQNIGICQRRARRLLFVCLMESLLRLFHNLTRTQVAV